MLNISPQLQRQIEERRRDARYSIEAQITATSQENFWCGFSENLSEGGVYLAMGTVPAVGELVHLSVRIGADAPVSAIGEVRWHRANAEGDVIGCGVQFVMLDPRAAELLQGMLARSAQAPLLVDE